jgi:N-acetylglucosaminyl-diphospho-decaprenol L-rhamnosyltransferase
MDTNRPIDVDVSILIISFNTRELTLGCLRSVQEQTRGVEYEVVVVDNASNDGSADAIAGDFPWVQLVRLSENIGFARANNLAAKSARGRYLLLLNPDTVILDGAVQKAVAFADANPRAGIVGGRTYFADHRLNYNSCHGAPTPWSQLCKGLGLSALFRRSRLFDPESLGNWERDDVREVDAVTGCFLLIDRELWNALRGFDESFFMYGEDTDLCLRAAELGRACMICPDCTLIHYGGQADSVRAEKMIRLFRAKAQLFRKHWSPAAAWFGVRMLRTWAFTRMAGLRLLSLLAPRRRGAYAAWREIWLRGDQYCGA